MFANKSRKKKASKNLFLFGPCTYMTFSKIVCLFQKFFDNEYIIWKYRLPTDKIFFCVISVNVQVISISEKYVLDFTFPSQFAGFETISY